MYINVPRKLILNKKYSHCVNVSLSNMRIWNINNIRNVSSKKCNATRELMKQFLSIQD